MAYTKLIDLPAYAKLKLPSQNTRILTHSQAFPFSIYM
jgi:hypothetical protein